MKAEEDAEIIELSRALESWRMKRQGKERIPENIWIAALELINKHSLYQVSRCLKLDYQQLKKRYQKTNSPQTPDLHTTNDKAAFLAISAQQLTNTYALPNSVGGTQC